MRIIKEFILNPKDDSEFITEAFGIDAGFKNKVVDVDIPTDFQIMYVTGDSGSGKTTLLKEMGFREHTLNIPSKPLFKWGVDEQETLKLLSLVGLGDATLFLSAYDELSDSQKARARLFLYLTSDDELIFVDEFLATLDRKTAKAVAYCFQKAVRKTNKKFILATSHDDLTNYLQADVIIKGKAFPSRWEIIFKEKELYNPFIDRITFQYVDKQFYRNLALGELHYKGKYTGGTKEYLAVFLNDDCIGILVSIFRMHDGGRRISRVVTHPSYRGCGIGVALVSKYIEDYEGADVVASMAKYNPIFEKAGMKRVKDSEIKAPQGLTKELKNIGFNTAKWGSKTYCLEFAKDNKELIAKYHKYASHLVCPAGEYLETDEIEHKIKTEDFTAGRVLWGLRPKVMAKFES